MRTRDFQAFNDGFDHALRVIESRIGMCSMGTRHLAGGPRFDYWWRRGVQMAIEFAERNWIATQAQLPSYRGRAR